MNSNYEEIINLIFTEIDGKIFEYDKLYQSLSENEKLEWDKLQKELDALSH